MSQLSLAPTPVRRAGAPARTALPAPRRTGKAARPGSAAASKGGRRTTAVVAPPQTRGVGIGFVAICLLAMVGGLVALLLLNTQRAQQSFALDRLQSQSASLAATQESLDSQLDAVSAPQQLALQAQVQGMVPATSIRFVDSNGKTVGVAKGRASTSPFTVGTLPSTPASKVAALAANAASAGVQLPAAPPATTLATVPPALPSTPSATATPKATQPTAKSTPSASATPAAKASAKATAAPTK
ncbi:hypothetical protein ATK17_0850 [Branchiibius hedensis]|uniref:Cell division protein FtsL n=1 Tax=Branchiibius hedensis TaxID=672460 RepID=A0A2Y8ZQA2_9MICO|nr:hypothetical protein [Branchiibius hedensis]PWJ24749.1 hypothetical protein ATK17_0850 [Branchiibius hedensis]SSA33566.1 hypothetical protein SAMN04489750_0850 [Branchiibius hedensis]